LNFNPVKYLAQGNNKQLAGISSHYPFFIQNVKQGSCEHGRRQRWAGGRGPLDFHTWYKCSR